MQLYIFLVACLLPVTLSLSFSVNLSRNSGRLLGGSTVSSIDQAPFMASILANGVHSCAGTIIAPNWVLTSATCATSTNLAFTKVRYNTLLHNLPLLSPDVPVGAIHLHPNYVSGSFDHNIALLQTKTSLDTGKGVALIPCKSSIHEGALVEFFGWGSTHEDSAALETELRVVKMPFLELKCASYYASMGIFIDSKNFCAGDFNNGGVGICGKGDEGGPAIRPGFGSVHGVASFSMGCGKARYGSVFVRVPSYASWISSKSGVECVAQV